MDYLSHKVNEKTRKEIMCRRNRWQKVRRRQKQCIFSKREQHKEEIKSPAHLIMHRCSLLMFWCTSFQFFMKWWNPCQGCVLLTEMFLHPVSLPKVGKYRPIRLCFSESHTECMIFLSMEMKSKFVNILCIWFLPITCSRITCFRICDISSSPLNILFYGLISENMVCEPPGPNSDGRCVRNAGC